MKDIENGKREKTKAEILEKARNILAYTHSSNENEAAVAATKLQELLFRYKLSMTDIQLYKGKLQSNGIIHLFEEINHRKNQGRWKLYLANSVARYNFCDILVAGNRIVFIGEPLDIELVVELFHWLEGEIEGLSKIACNGYTGLDRLPTFRRAFLQGCTLTINRRLYKQWQALKDETEQSTALVRVNKQALNTYMADKIGKIRRPHRAKPRQSMDGYRQGKEAGNQVDIRNQRKLEE